MADCADVVKWSVGVADNVAVNCGDVSDDVAKTWQGVQLTWQPTMVTWLMIW